MNKMLKYYIIAAIIISYRIVLAGVSEVTPIAEIGVTPGSAQRADSLAADSIASDSIDAAIPTITELEELVVVERQKLVKNDGEKLTYNLSEDPEAATANILDILRKVPGVTVDADENIKVNGKSSFKILQNGADNPMFKGDLKTVLKSIPAATINRIEVISEPGAKYDAEGVGGILNIVTDSSRKMEGFMTSFGAWVNSSQAGGMVSARAKLHNVMLQAGVSYNNSRPFSRSFRSETITEYLSGSDNKMQISKSKSKSGWDFISPSFSMSWEPDTLNLFTAYINYGYNSWGSPHNRSEWHTYGEDMQEKWSITRDNSGNSAFHNAGAQVSYQHNFGRDDNNIVASYLFGYTHLNSDETYIVIDTSGSYT